MTADDPARPDRGGQPQPALHVARGQAAAEHLAQVGGVHVVAPEHVHRGCPPGRDHRHPHRLGLLHHGQRVVPQPQLDGRGLARVGEPLGRVRADAVQQPVPRLAEHFRLHHDQGLVHQRRGQVDDLTGRQAVIGTDLLGHLQRPAREHRQAAQQHLLRPGQQVMAPVDGRPERALPGRRGPAARAEQGEPVTQPVGDLLSGQHGHPRCGQLDGQRHPIQRPADRGHRHRVALGDGETRAGGRGPVGEQLDRLIAREFLGIGHRPGGRDIERDHLPDGFLRDAQRFLAGHQDAQPGAAGEQPLAQPGARIDQVLAAVQHDQDVPFFQRAGQRVQQRPAGLAIHADERGHPGHDQVRFPQIAQLDDAHPVRELAADHAEQPQRQAGLADAARAAQGERSRPVQRQPEVAQFTFPPDEPVRFPRQVSRKYRWSHFPNNQDYPLTVSVPSNGAVCPQYAGARQYVHTCRVVPGEVSLQGCLNDQSVQVIGR